MSAAASVLLPAIASDFQRPDPRSVLCLCPAVAEASALSDREARAEIVAMRSALCRRARRWLVSRAEADDLVQETLLRALGGGSRFSSVNHLRAWLFTVLHNLFVSSRRRAQSARNALRYLEPSPAAPDGWLAAGGAGFLSPSVKTALLALPPVFREVIQLVDLEDHTYLEAAAVLEVPVGTVMSRLSRGRRRLAEVLAAEP